MTLRNIIQPFFALSGICFFGLLFFNGQLYWSILVGLIFLSMYQIAKYRNDKFDKQDFWYNQKHDFFVIGMPLDCNLRMTRFSAMTNIIYVDKVDIGHECQRIEDLLVDYENDKGDNLCPVSVYGYVYGYGKYKGELVDEFFERIEPQMLRIMRSQEDSLVTRKDDHYQKNVINTQPYEHIEPSYQTKKT